MYNTVNHHRAFAYAGNRRLDPTQPAIVFIHGAANDHSVWALQSRYFAYHGWNSLAVDLPGHGRSEGQPISDVGALADWLIALLDEVGIQRTAVAGHSMGSLVALETAARHPSRVTHLTLIGTAVPMPVSEPLLKASAANEHVAYEMINAFAHSPAAQIGGNRIPGMWMMGNSMRLMERSAAGVLHADFTACNDYAGGLEAAARVRCPSLLILGKRDQMTPMKAARNVTASLANATMVALEGAGHALMAEQPDAVLDALIEFLNKDRR